MKQALIIFAKNLVQGKVKTRLAAAIGNDKAFAVYKELLQHTAAVTGELPVAKLLFYSDYIDDNDGWGNCFQKMVQTGGDLGEKMFNAFATAFAMGYKNVVIIGTDNPELNRNILLDAFRQLQTSDVVIGPATDGGYYLLGMKKNHPAFFRDIAWSTATVFAETLSRIRESGLTVCLLPLLSDIDEEKDLPLLQKLKQGI